MWPTCGQRWLHNRFIVGGSRCSAREKHHPWPTCGHDGYITPAFSAVPSEKIRSGPLVGNMNAAFPRVPSDQNGGGGDQRWAHVGKMAA